MICHRQVCVIIKHSLNYARDERTNLTLAKFKAKFCSVSIEYQHTKKNRCHHLCVSSTLKKAIDKLSA